MTQEQQLDFESFIDVMVQIFFQNFIESITIYPDKKTNERIVDEIDFKFPISALSDQCKCEMASWGNRELEAETKRNNQPRRNPNQRSYDIER